jgi:uncharacterized protein YraI
MRNSTDFQLGRGCAWIAVAGWVIVVVLGIILVWFGFLHPSNDGQSEEAQASATAMVALVQTLTQPTSTALPPGMVTPTAAVASPPLSTATAEPATATAPSATDTPLAATATATAAPEPTVTPGITAGSQGVNVRSGPGTNYSIIGSLDPGAQAPVTGKYGDWWQIQYNAAPGWVFGEIVTASNVENVPEVQPPPVPTRPPATAAPAPTAVPPTAVAPPTATPPPAAGTRGLVADGYQVEGAPGPYHVGQDIWFDMWITNKSGAPVEFVALGTWIQENGQYQKSWSYSEIPSDRQFTHRDHIYSNQITAPGTYHLFLRICFSDGQCADLAGPVEIIVQ